MTPSPAGRKHTQTPENAIIEDIGDDTTKGESTQEIEHHHIYKDDLIRLLQKAEPGRARFWALLYYLGCRYGELKCLGPQHLRPDYGDYGGIKILNERSKSKKDRTIQLYSEIPLKLIE